MEGTLTKPAKRGHASSPFPDFDAQLNDLQNQLDECHEELRELGLKKYSKYLPGSLRTGEVMVGRLEELSQTTQLACSKLTAELEKHAQISSSELGDVADRLADTGKLLSALQALAAISDMHTAVEKSLRVGQFFSSAELLCRMDESLKALSLEHDEFCDKRNVVQLSEDLLVKREQLIFDLLDFWGHNVSWLVSLKAEEPTTFTLSLDPSNDLHRQAIMALNILNILPSKLQHLADCLHKHIFEPIVRNSTTLVVNSDAALVLTVVDECVPSPTEVLKKLGDVVDVLVARLDFTLIPGEATVLTKLGELSALRLLELLVKECLKRAVPTDMSGVEQFQLVLDAVSAFESRLRQCKMLSPNQRPLAEHAADIDTLFTDKKCQRMLERVRELLRADLHDTVSVELRGTEVVPADNVGTAKEALRFDFDKCIPAVFHLPQCRISKSVLEMLDMVSATLQAATSASPLCAHRFCQTARNMYELYLDLVQEYHKSLVEDVPLVSGVFFNNCMFMAHRAMTLDSEFYAKLQSTLRASQGILGSSLSFTDFVPRFRCLAEETMQAQLQRQKSLLSESLKLAGGFSKVATESGVDKALKQCVFQLQHLHRVWKDVMTTTMLLRCMAILVDHMLVAVINSLLKLEDIPSEDATKLQKLLALVSKNIETLFTSSADDKKSEIHRFCYPTYPKFLEVQQVLSGSLQDIDNRWAGGSGPLALYFSDVEVKHFVRALFQNTERRAALLARIKPIQS